jgi:hypothetical protein
LLAAYLLMAVLGTWTQCLLLNDGALLLSVGWLGNPWDLYFGQFPDRAVALFMSFGPAWAARALFGLSASAYITLSHALFFAVPVAFWLVLRAIEPQRAFSRLYLAMALAFAYFPSELIVGAGFWTLCLALACDPARSGRQVAGATGLLGLTMAFTHPGTALMSVLFFAIAGALSYFGRPVPRRALGAALGLSILLLAAFLIEGRWLHPTNPTIVAGIAAARSLFIDPTALLYTLIQFPALAVLWLLMVAPGADAAHLRWRLAPWAVWLMAIVGLWFAVNGTSFRFYLYVRYSAGYALALALALAVAGEAWAARARCALSLFALVGAATALSYTFDVWLFGNYVDSRLRAGIVDVDTATPAWPRPVVAPDAALTPFKWLARGDYMYDGVVPDYGRYRWSLAFYSYFRSDRAGSLYHRLPANEWVPFECPAVSRALAGARDDLDRRFIAFLGERYCVK